MEPKEKKTIKRKSKWQTTENAKVNSVPVGSKWNRFCHIKIHFLCSVENEKKRNDKNHSAFCFVTHFSSYFFTFGFCVFRHFLLLFCQPKIYCYSHDCVCEYNTEMYKRNSYLREESMRRNIDNLFLCFQTIFYFLFFVLCAKHGNKKHEMEIFCTQF